MADAPRIPRNTSPRKPKPQATPSPHKQDVPSCNSGRGCPFASLRNFIDWMNLVDEFSLAGHPNQIPRWGFMMLILLYMVLH